MVVDIELALQRIDDSDGSRTIREDRKVLSFATEGHVNLVE